VKTTTYVMRHGTIHVPHFPPDVTTMSMFPWNDGDWAGGGHTNRGDAFNGVVSPTSDTIFVFTLFLLDSFVSAVFLTMKCQIA